MAYLERNKDFVKTGKILFMGFSLLLLFNSCNNKTKKPFFGNNQIVVKLINGNYLTEARNNNNDLSFNSPSQNDSGIFYVSYNQNNSIKIKSSTAHFLRLDNKTSRFKADVLEEEEATSFILQPYKQYYKIKTENGGNLIVNEEFQLEISQGEDAQLFHIKNYSTIPPSWYSFREIGFGKFFVQLIIFLGLITIVFRLSQNKLNKNTLSIKTILVVGFVLIYVVFNTKKWKDNLVIQSDVVGYYEYLPAAFIFNDMSFNFINNLPEDFKGLIWTEVNEETGNRFTRYSMGTAIMYLPFFLIGHVLANALDYTTYGYSEPYQMMIALGCWFYVFLALFYLRKILLTYFNDTVTAFTLFSVVMATNLFYYTTIEPGMSHAYSFFLIVVFIWYTIKWHKNKSMKRAVILGATIGLITLVRPTNGLIALFFMFYGVTSLSKLKEQTLLFWQKKIQLFILISVASLVWLPQLAFWKYATDNWFFFSYGDNPFYFNKPHILDGLFSYRKGWLLYTPIMFFAILGVFGLYKKQKKLVLPIALFIVLNIYVVYSWWCWYYGGSFSSRPMVDSYGLMAISLAAFFSYFDKKTNYFKTIPVVIIIFTVSLNLFQTQQTKTCLHWASMTEEAYWTNFTTLGWPDGYDSMLRAPDDENLIKGLDEYPEDKE
jgi:hypothetical protein